MGKSFHLREKNKIKLGLVQIFLWDWMIVGNIQLPSAIFAKLSGGKVFSKLDLCEAYLQIPVNEEYGKYLTIKMLKGLYRFNRLPFRIKISPGTFQQIMDTLLNDIDFAIAYLDIFIKSESREQHAKHVLEIFVNIKQYGLKLSWDKCEFFKSKIKYSWQKGRMPNPLRLSAIKNMPAPTNVSTLQAFLGLANYYGNFIPNIHILRASLNRLLKKRFKMELEYWIS